jgi:hypothetical protein
MVYKGAINASGDPNYPAASSGHTYKISVAGKIGGGSGPTVEVGDMIICITDDTAAGTHAAVGAHWNIIQTNVANPVERNGTFTANQLVIGHDTVTIKTLAGGTDGKILKMVSGSPAWADESPGFLNPMTTLLDLIVGGVGGTPERFGVGSSNEGKILAINGGGNEFEWVDRYVHPTDNEVGTVPPIVATGGTVISQIKVANTGHVTEISTRELELTDLGAMANWVTKPATHESSGTAGQMAYDATDRMLYICVAPSTWRRTPLSKW